MKPIYYLSMTRKIHNYPEDDGGEGREGGRLSIQTEAREGEGKLRRRSKSVRPRITHTF